MARNEVLPPNPFWRFEVVVMSPDRRVPIFPTSRHWRKSEAEKHAASIRKLIDPFPESKYLTADVRRRAIEPWELWAIIAGFFALAIFMRVTGWEFPTWLNALVICVFIVSVIPVVRQAFSRKRHSESV